jgi:hypothetical protein
MSNEQIIAALEQAEGILVDAATLLGIKRYELEDRLNDDPYLNRIHLSIVEGMIDGAQKNIFTAVKAGNYAASVFVLTTLAKERGYSTKAELSLKTVGKSFDDMSEKELLDFLEQSGFKLELGDEGMHRITAMPS